jgi:hypothetical protein
MKRIFAAFSFLAAVACSTTTTETVPGDPGSDPGTPDTPPGETPPGTPPPGAPGKDDISITGTFTRVPLTDAIWNLSDVTVVSPKRVYAVGSGNGKSQVFEYDGTTWTDSVADPIFTGLATVGGSAWAFGTGGVAENPGSGWVDHWPVLDETFVLDLWGSSNNDIWLIGNHGTYHWSGASWTKATDPNLTDIAFDSVWGAATDDVWLSLHTSGSRGKLFHYDGKAWTDVWQALPKELRDAYYSVYGIQGSAHDNVWALSGANGGTVVHHDGTAWSISAPPASGWGCTLSSVWASGKKNAWLAGKGGCIFHWDGAAWSKVDSGVTANLYHLSGSAADNVWLVTEGKDLLHLVPTK